MSIRPIRLNPACIKTLSAVEASPDRSNQHEFNGVKALKDMFGLAKFQKTAKFSIRGTSTEAWANVTWYDAREDHPTRTEHRLYFQSNTVMAQAREGDNILIGFESPQSLHVILIKAANHGGGLPIISSWERTS